jgi:hypothetical protein
MLSYDGRSCMTSKWLAVSVVALGLQTIIAGAAFAGAQQSIYLPDPTPRPPDLQRQYSDDPAERSKQEQAAKLLNKMRLQQVTLATNTMLTLAQEMKNQLSNQDQGSTMASEMLKAGQIESLAKKVKEALRPH